MKKEIIYAGGCFWGVQKYFDLIHGVVGTRVGYANGRGENPSYEQVCGGRTGFAEAVWVEYAPESISLETLTGLFFEVIDPTVLNRQGFDIGTQYRTGIYYTDQADEAALRSSLTALQKRLELPVVVELTPLDNFYAAEEYHQKYLDKTPRGYCHISQKDFERAAKANRPKVKFAVPSKQELEKRLTPMQFAVTQNAATEPPFANEYCDNFKRGIYVDIATGEPLFVSRDKFDSGCGWPAFSKPIDRAAISEVEDLKYGMRRTEVRSVLSDAHLGHVFADGPEEQGGLRYCINSAALRCVPETDMEAQGYREYIHLLDE